MTDRLGTRRVTFMVKVAVIAGVAVAALAGTSIVASAYEPPTEHHSIECSPEHVDPGGSCDITFKDQEKDSGVQKGGQLVCFTLSSPTAGTVTGEPPVLGHSNCTRTDSKGVAHGDFTASTKACSNDSRSKGHDDDGRNVAITGTETAEKGGSARTTVQVTCEQHNDDNNNNGNNGNGNNGNGNGNNNSDSNGGGGSTNSSFRTAAALTVPAVTPAASFSMAGILVAMVLLAVAITGRLRLRLRRRRT